MTLSAYEMEALWLSIQVALCATMLSLPFAVALAWLLARYQFRGRLLLETCLQLPMVMPPVVLGYLLLLAFGTHGFLGQYLYEWFGIRLVFNWKGAVLAAMVTAFPLMVQPIRLSFEKLEIQLEKAAATLGARTWQIFIGISLPQAFPGILIGCVLGFSRSLGEFGATITFVGNIAGETRTLPLAIYSLLQQPDGEQAAARLVFLSIALAFVSLLINTWLITRHHKKTGQSHHATL